MHSTSDSNYGADQASQKAASVHSAQIRVRPKSAYAKNHHIVEKDFYRIMKSDNYVNKHFAKQKQNEFGRCPPKPMAAVS